MNEVKKIFSDKLHTPLWLTVLMIIVLILRIPTFFEPYVHNIETVLLALGEAIRRGMDLYKDIFLSSAPLMPLTAAVAGNLFVFKSILAVWHLATIYIFWRLSNSLFPKNNQLQQVSTVVFALFSTFPLLGGNVVSPEMFMTGPVILTFYLLLDKKLNNKKLLTAGFVFSIAIMFKSSALFEVFAIFFLWLTISNLEKKKLKEALNSMGWVSVGALTPILLSFIYYWLKDTSQQYFVSAYLPLFSYLISGGVVIITAHLFLYWKRNTLSKKYIFLFSWLLLSLMSVIYSGVPHSRYLLHSLAPVSLFFGMLVTKKDMEQPLSIIPLIIFFFIPYYYGFSQPSTTNYYKNFINFSTGDITNEQYLNYFDNNVVRNYKISSFVEQSTARGDYIFVWGDSDLYALTKRLPPTPHLINQQATNYYKQRQLINQLGNRNPKFIIILPEAQHNPQLTAFLNDRYGLHAKMEGVQIWRLLKPDIRALIAPSDHLL